MCSRENATQQLLIFWAKIGHGPTQPKPFHPLLCHMVDAGQVAHSLWNHVLSPATRGSIVETLGVSDETAARWVSFWAGLHDLGKASPSFQLEDSAARSRIQAAGLPCHGARGKPPHGTLTAASVRAILPASFGLPDQLSSQVGTVLGAITESSPARTRCAVTWSVLALQMASLLARRGAGRSPSLLPLGGGVPRGVPGRWLRCGETEPTPRRCSHQRNWTVLIYHGALWC